MNLNNLLNLGAVVNDTTTNGLNFIIVIMVIITIILAAIFMFSPKD